MTRFPWTPSVRYASVWTAAGTGKGLAQHLGRADTGGSRPASCQAYLPLANPARRLALACTCRALLEATSRLPELWSDLAASLASPEREGALAAFLTRRRAALRRLRLQVRLLCAAPAAQRIFQG